MSYKDTIAKNLARVEELVHEVVPGPGGEPLFNWIEISPIDACNRACAFCPKSDPKVAPNTNQVMPPVLYRKLADELGALGYKGTVMLAGYGEPLLSRHIFDMAATFAAVCNVEVTTNGDPLTPKVIRQLLDAGVGKIVVSLYDGPEQTSKFETLIAESGAPRDRFILRDRWYDETSDFGVKLTNRAGMVSIGKQPPVLKTAKCFYVHYSMNVDWNGDVFLCTQDWNRRVKSGNLMLNTVLEVWNSSTLRKYRLHLAEGRRDLTPCDGCNAVGTLHGGGHADAWLRYYKAAKAER